MQHKLMTRDNFRESVFKRDNNQCVVPGCNAAAVDAHHIIERSLWTDESQLGGYFLANGASVCEEHHKLAERDIITPQTLREYAGIDDRILPVDFIRSCDPFNHGMELVRQEHTKWGVNLKHPTRLFCKYPSTLYFPFSPGVDELDISEHGFAKLENFVNVPVYVTIKMDGSNVVLRQNTIAARNGDSALHGSYDALKAYHAGVGDLIPSHIQLFGEWLYAKHSIHYIDLDAHLQLFRAYDTKTEMFLGLSELQYYADLIGATVVPRIGEIFIFKKEYEAVNQLTKMAEDVITQGHEGIVVSSVFPFHYGQFSQRVAKYVRPNHVTTSKHWSKNNIIKNKLKRK